MAVQRLHRAACPGCGAPVDFRSAQSAYAVCSYCHSTVVRDGQTLARIGRMAELFEDHSPLQLLAQGRWQGQSFTLVGRMQYRGASGGWTEWHALLDDGSSVRLAEDHGAYVLAVPARTDRPLPAAQQLRLGATTAIDGRSYQVAFNALVALVAAQGELPRLPTLDRPFAMVQLRSADNELLSIDYGSTPPELARGRATSLAELHMSGLREQGGSQVQGRHFACPQCGAQVDVARAESQSITCRACLSLIDLRRGLYKELFHAEQHEPVQPLIPLGASGRLQGVPWQVVGYQHRLGTEPDDPDAHFGWDEYLLYNRRRGFSVLVDAQEGWSVHKPLTGAPRLSPNLQLATYLGASYALLRGCRAQTTYVAGEFYWPVERGHTAFARSYARGDKLLVMEDTPRARTWSAGGAIASDKVARAFGLEEKKELLRRSEADRSGSARHLGCSVLVLACLASLALLVLVVLVVLRAA